MTTNQKVRGSTPFATTEKALSSTLAAFFIKFVNISDTTSKKLNYLQVTFMSMRSRDSSLAT
jgi:hypothetical protein